VLVTSSISNNENTENLWAALESNHDYVLKVVVAGNQTPFDWDYALAWRREADADFDGIADNNDNCLLIANAAQRDSNEDGYGNVCDADLNNNGIVDPLDFSTLKSLLGTINSDADLNGNGIVDPLDFSRLKSLLGTLPGPSGLAP
jgi:hypothetical protein